MVAIPLFLHTDAFVYFLYCHTLPFTVASLPTGLALPLSKITILDLSKNRLTSTEPFAHLMLTLEELWLSSNDIKDFQAVEYIAETTGRKNFLQGIYLEFNPVAQEFEYRKRLAQ